MVRVHPGCSGICTSHQHLSVRSVLANCADACWPALCAQVGNDWFLLANDFASYLKAQEEVDKVYADQKEWTRRSIVYTATSGKFSSDRTIVEYAQDIWGVTPCKPTTW
jgi:glucan phosphorylase